MWFRFRTVVMRLVDNAYFEWVVLVMIIASSIALCFEDKYLYLKPSLKFYLRWANLVFAALFTIEMVLKWIAFGLKKYYTNAWTILDFIIVVVRQNGLWAYHHRCGKAQWHVSIP